MTTPTDIEAVPAAGRKPGRLASGALLAAALCAFAFALAAASASAALPARFFGVAPQDPLKEADAARMERGGVQLMRVPVHWSRVQPTRTGGYDWDFVDRQVELAARNDIEVMPVFHDAPRWATGSRTRLPVDNAAQRTAWRKFLTAAVRRYGPDGDFWKPDPVEEADRALSCGLCTPRTSRIAPDTPVIPIRIWQIWNEENFFYFTRPASPQRYAALLKISRPAIRRVSPTARVIIGGLFGRPREKPPKALAADRFLTELYRVRGVKAFFDGVALHPYSPSADGLRRITETIRRVMRRSGDARTGLYITEMGWGSQANTGVAFEKGRKGQARELRRAYSYLTANQGRLNLQAVFWFAWKDAVGSSCVFCDSVGLFPAGDGMRAKPAWYEFVKFTGGLPGPPPDPVERLAP